MVFFVKKNATVFLPLIWLKMREIAAMAKPEATAVANTERPLPDTAEAAAAPATTRLKRKVAKHSTATARHSSKLRTSMDIGGFLSVTSALFSRRADSLDRMVTMCESTSRAKDSVVILGFVVTQSLIREKKKTDTTGCSFRTCSFKKCECHMHFYRDREHSLLSVRTAITLIVLSILWIFSIFKIQKLIFFFSQGTVTVPSEFLEWSKHKIVSAAEEGCTRCCRFGNALASGNPTQWWTSGPCGVSARSPPHHPHSSYHYMFDTSVHL